MTIALSIAIAILVSLAIPYSYRLFTHNNPADALLVIPVVVLLMLIVFLNGWVAMTIVDPDLESHDAQKQRMRARRALEWCSVGFILFLLGSIMTPAIHPRRVSTQGEYLIAAFQGALVVFYLRQHLATIGYINTFSARMLLPERVMKYGRYVVWAGIVFGIALVLNSFGFAYRRTVVYYPYNGQLTVIAATTLSVAVFMGVVFITLYTSFFFRLSMAIKGLKLEIESRRRSSDQEEPPPP